jgi:hypothetical protein
MLRSAGAATAPSISPGAPKRGSCGAGAPVLSWHEGRGDLGGRLRLPRVDERGEEGDGSHHAHGAHEVPDMRKRRLALPLAASDDYGNRRLSFGTSKASRTGATFSSLQSSDASRVDTCDVLRQRQVQRCRRQAPLGRSRRAYGLKARSIGSLADYAVGNGERNRPDVSALLTTPILARKPSLGRRDTRLCRSPTGRDAVRIVEPNRMPARCRQAAPSAVAGIERLGAGWRSERRGADTNPAGYDARRALRGRLVALSDMALRTPRLKTVVDRRTSRTGDSAHGRWSNELQERDAGDQARGTVDFHA